MVPARPGLHFPDTAGLTQISAQTTGPRLSRVGQRLTGQQW